MNTIRPIRSDEDLDAALKRIEKIFDAAPDTPEGAELDALFALVERYEEKHDPIGLPDPIEAIKFRMDQQNLTQRDLIPFIGSRSKVSEVLSGKRDITMSMARALHKHLGIPADVLLQEPGLVLSDELSDIEFSRFPLRAMVNAGWIPKVPHLKDKAEELVTHLMELAGGPEGGRKFATAPMYRKNDSRRINAKTDDFALRAWCWQVLAQANEMQTSVEYQHGTINDQLLREVAQFSVFEDGPIRARDFLAKYGIGLEYVKHLPKTHLDGAALQGSDGRPVIGLTLRYDRIDNFWFTLLHELSHVARHMYKDSDEKVGFIDDHTLRNVTTNSVDTKEEEADDLAQDSLIPVAIWNDGVILNSPRPTSVLQMAVNAQVHPAIVAGRIRHELENYRLLSQFVGTGEVRKQFETRID